MQRPVLAPVVPDGGLPVLTELQMCFDAATSRTVPEPVGGGPALHTAARGYWSRRGLDTDPDRVVAAPGAQPLLLALLAAIGGDVLLSRPCAAWYEPLARLVERPAYHAPASAECGGLPDPFALLEMVRRVRAEGGEPRTLVLSVADDPTGTVAPPELLHEVCEVAVAERLLVISDETWRDTVHRPHETVLLSPAEMFPQQVVVLTDLAGAFTPPGWPAAIARLPGGERGTELRSRVLATLDALRAGLSAPVAEAAAHALTEPEAVRGRLVVAARAHGAIATEAHRILTAEGGVCRPPQAGAHLYADLDELREVLETRQITDSVELERYLTGRLGWLVPGGHHFGDSPDALRVRLSMSPLFGATDEQRLRAVHAPNPLEVPHVSAQFARFAGVFEELGQSSG